MLPPPRLDLSRFACPRQECPDYDKHDRPNLRPRGRYGREQWLQIVCRTCGRSFSERRASPVYPLRLRPDQVVRVLRELSVRESIRGAAAKAGLDKMTVHGLVRLAELRRAQFRPWLAGQPGLEPKTVRQILHYLAHRDEMKRKNRFA